MEYLQTDLNALNAVPILSLKTVNNGVSKLTCVKNAPVVLLPALAIRLFVHGNSINSIAKALDIPFPMS